MSREETLGDIEAMLLYAKELSEYDIVGHFHTCSDLDASDSSEWLKDALELIWKEPSKDIEQKRLFELFDKDAKVVYPENTLNMIVDPTGWYESKEHAQTAFANIIMNIESFDAIDTPQSGLFWANGTALKNLLSVNIKEQSQKFESNDLLRRLLLLFAVEADGKAYRIHKDDSLLDYRFYEEQRDYSSQVINSDIKVLSYYLPQFHPIAENDEWHGKGFTEWTKVRAANPLFEGHFKQHIPHKDIGYYLLDSPAILQKQADMMKKSGVYGQIFYHYWFSGKLILEEPAKMLLEHKEIDMPFCFCWANENWTRRWDGDDEDVLLGQVYSREDARAFIQYLIPFFQDSRHITVEGRPVLYIYRPASVPDMAEYLDIWAQECASVGLPKPYMVSVLTRGATNPNDFLMDAGTERILHDWTDGAVADIAEQLHEYKELNAHILPYDKVSSFYMEQKEHKSFTYFRAIIATWDNTARYGKDAYIVHDSTPYLFGQWLETLVAYARETLNKEERFIVVNAWNEWAEGAHLEPDTHYGYSYLNSIGRVLAGQPYAEQFPATSTLIQDSTLELSFDDEVVEALSVDNILKEQFLTALKGSTILNKATLFIKQESLKDLLVEHMPTLQLASSQEASYILKFSKPALFDGEALEKMLALAIALPESIIIPNNYTNSSQPYPVTENGSTVTEALYKAPFVLYSNSSKRVDQRNIRMRRDAHSFNLTPSEKMVKDRENVTAIIRLHRGAEFDELKRALYSLASSYETLVTPLITLQDLDITQKEELGEMLATIPFAHNIEPIVIDYGIMGLEGDLRTLMMNDALKHVKSRYAVFLDHDDIIFSDAYSWLLDRLKTTGKAVSFGRVYATTFDSKLGVLTKREKDFEYGYSFEDFLHDNHAPIHSFMLDLEQINLTQVVYHEDQKYMEDYYLTLQIFTKQSGDWESLRLNKYIGDYIHSSDREHTLAISDVKKKEELLGDPIYQRDEQRIVDLRKSLI